MRGEWGVALDRVGEKEEENRWNVACICSLPPLSPSITHRFEALPDLEIRNQLLSIRSGGKFAMGGGEGEGRAGLPGANRRNAVSIIQLKTDMYIGIRWELSQSLRLSIARRLSDDRSGRKIEGNAIVGWMQRPLPTLCRSLRFVASLILRSEVFESREGVMFRNLIVTFRIFLDQQINFLSFNMFSDL